MQTVLISGGTGMIGRALTKKLLERNYRVIILTRNAGKPQPVATNLSYSAWDIPAQTIDPAAIAQADYLIHLAGADVAEKRWTTKRKQEIADSRIKTGELLVKALKEYPNQIRAVIGISGIGWYGPDPLIPNPHPFTESDKAHTDFLATTCRQWEMAIGGVIALGKRFVCLRSGVVLSNEGGAMKEFVRPLRCRVATILGHGRQMVSWIHIDDLARLFIAAMENGNMSGVYNAVAPGPVSNKELMLKLAEIKKGRFFIPVYVPSFVLKLVLGEMSIEVLKSATVGSDRLHQAGFIFRYPSVDAALQQLAGPAHPSQTTL